ncbi:MAG: helix-turn-helix domain-containing protein [Gemmiger sp.]|nr:helix-turn-helix domain-containing protein [Gemmiger sp.]
MKPITNPITVPERKTRNYKNRIFIQLVLLVSVPLLVVGVLAWRSYAAAQRSRNDLLLESMQQNVTTQLENTAIGIRNYYLDAAKGDTFSWLLNASAVPYSQYSSLNAAQKLLQGSSYMDQYIKSYEFLNLRECWVLNNYGLYPYTDARNYDEIAAFVAEQSANALSVYWLHRPDAATAGTLRPSRTVDLSGELLVLKLSTSTYGVKCMLLVHLNTEYFTQLLQSWAGDAYELSIFDRENNLIATTDAAFSQAYLDAGMAAGTGVTGLRAENAAGKPVQYSIVSQEMSANGFVYLAGYDVAAASAGQNLALVISMIVAAATVLILAICRWSSAFLYRPVRDLMGSVQTIFGAKDGSQDEFSYLALGVNQLAQSKDNLQELVGLQQSQLQELFMTHLVRSEVTAEAITHTLAEFNIRPCACYRMASMLCSPPGGETEQRPTGPEREALALTIVQQMPAALKQRMFICPAALGRRVLFAVGGAEDAALTQALNALCKDIHRYVGATFGCTALIGVSEPFHTLSHMRTAYHESTEALRSRTFMQGHEGDSIAYYTQPLGSDFMKNAYDVLLERELCAAVNGCDTNETDRLLQCFIDRLSNKKISGHERSFYLYRIVNAILSVGSNAGLSMNDIFSDQRENSFEMLSQIYAADTLHSFLLNDVALPVIQLLNEHRQADSPDLVNQVMQLIKETHGDITLTECAEKLNYHPSYIWKVLKSDRNATFTDYVNREKLEMAKQMLITTPMTVAAISDTLHYANVQNFIRFFNKELGMTPGKYRKEYRIEKGENPEGPEKAPNATNPAPPEAPQNSAPPAGNQNGGTPEGGGR